MPQKVKYPRTYHLPWSPGLQNDDKKMETTSYLEGQNIVVTEKSDGENTSMYRDHIHARSLDSGYHESRDAVKKIWGDIKHNIPENFRVCGENMYAKHSIFYDNLESYFLVFSVWDGLTCLSWEDTLEWIELLGLSSVTVLYQGIYDENVLQGLYKDSMEGYVVRVTDSFEHSEFPVKAGKFVRKGHVQTSEHWMSQAIVKNEVKNET